MRIRNMFKVTATNFTVACGILVIFVLFPIISYDNYQMRRAIEPRNSHCVEETTTTVDPDILEDRDMQREFAARKANVQSVCKSLKNKSGTGTAEMAQGQDRILLDVDWPRVLDGRSHQLRGDPTWWKITMHVLSKFDVLYCHIPKVASRNILRYFVQLSEPDLDESLVKGLQVHTGDSKQLRYVVPLAVVANASAARAQHYMDSFKKIVFVRNPLDRLLSAWADKLYLKNELFRKHYGRDMIRRYRQNATVEELIDGYPVYLGEFLNYLIGANNSLEQNSHWKPMYSTCTICALDYDFIGRFENIERELAYIGKSIAKPLKLPDLISTEETERNRSHPHIDRYGELRRLPRKLVKEALKKHYEIDYKMFGYDMEKDLEKVYGPSQV